jgi:protein TonB
MGTDGTFDVYSLQEVARAAGVSEAQVRAAAGGARLLSSRNAVRLGRAIVADRRAGVVAAEARLFSRISDPTSLNLHGLPLAVSGSLHAVLLASIVVLLGFRTSAASAAREQAAEPARLVFLATPGPGGGGGGGGLLQPAPLPRAETEGRNPIATPLPHRIPPRPVEPAPAPPEPKPRVLTAEPLPAIVAPIVSAPNDDRTRSGLLEQVAAARGDEVSRGAGRGGGVGSGAGTGIGEGDGSGIGPGSGGGIGGGPYRPGSGITPPRVLREVKADYTEAARQRALTGEVVLEIVVRRDGSVGDVKLLQGLGLGLDDRAIAAVRQWRFAPAERLGVPVDVLVEVGVEFRLR